MLNLPKNIGWANFLCFRIDRIFVFTILFTFILSQGFSQQNEEEFLAQKIPNLIPPSPNSAALGKFGDIPVGLYTGAPTISLPIFNVSLSGINVPVSLDYHASGVKVEELASSVGLGWALNAGGVITKTIRGSDDMLPGGFLYSNEGGQSVSDYVNGFMSSSEENDFRQSVARGLIDTQPDIYSFNFSSNVGKFHINPNGEIITVPFQSLRVTKDSNGFTITDHSGTQYLFYEKETTFSNPVIERDGQVQPYLDPEQYTSSWYLSKIISINGDEVVFNYISANIEPEYPTSEIRYFRNSLEVYCPESIPFEMEYGIKTYQETEIVQKKISSISFPNGEVEFVYENMERADLKGDMALNSVLVNNNDSVIKSFVLTQDYYSGRMFLTEVLELDKNGQSIGSPYRIQYLNPQSLPPRLSKAQDYWGFYNGNTSNLTLIPKENNSGFGQTIGFLYTNGADRSPNSSFLKNGTINKLSYPTGGYTIFEFEPHEFGNLGGSKDILDTLRTSQSVTTSLTAPASGSMVEQNFTITHNQIVEVQSSVSGYNTYVRLHNVTNGNSIIYGAESNGSTSVQTQNISIPLNEGNYKLVAFNYEEEFVAQISVDHEQNSSTYTLNKNRIGGGVRIKRITDYGREDEKINDKLFKYFLPDEEDRSSGVLVAQYNHDYYKFESACVTCNGSVSVSIAKYLVRMSTSAISMSYSEGSAVEYSDVTVYEDGGSLGAHHGKSHSSYRTSRDKADLLFTSFPFMPPVSKSYFRGQLKEENTYKAEGGSFIPVKKVVNQYSSYLNPNGATYFLNIGFLRNYNCYVPANTTFVESIGAYASEFVFNSKTTEILYDNSGSQNFKIITDYEYGNLDHLLPTSVTVNNSNGDLETTKYFYPDDVNSSSTLNGEVLTSAEYTAINSLKSNFRHHINTPVQIEKWNGNNLLAKRRSLFKIWDTDLILTHKIMTSLGNDQFNTRLEYFSYDEIGNPRSASNNGETVGMMWSYNGKYPIAEASNATFDEISFTSFETPDKGGWTYTGSLNTSTYKTGMKAYNLGSGSVTKTGIGASASTPYKVGFWARRTSGAGNVNVGGQTEALTTSWKWVEKTITSPSLTISGSSVVIDELRLHPADAMMTSYTYEPLVGMTSQTDPRGYTLIYEYDTANRLKTIKDEEGKILEHYEYNYATGN